MPMWWFVHAKRRRRSPRRAFGVMRYTGYVQRLRFDRSERDRPASQGMDGVVAALQAIKAKVAPFISRGDRSGTHIRELDLWKAAGHRHRERQGHVAEEIGQDMGATLATPPSRFQRLMCLPIAAPGVV